MKIIKVEVEVEVNNNNFKSCLISEIKDHLDKCGFGIFWITQQYIYIYIFETHVDDIENQNWSDDVSNKT